MPKNLSFAMMAVVCLTLGACSPTPSKSVSDAGSSSSTSTVPSSIRLVQSSSSTDEGVVLIFSSSSKEMMRSSAASQRSSVAASKAAAVRTMQMKASNFAFTPSHMTAKKGEKVRLQISGTSGIHGVAIPGLAINVRVEAGQTVSVDLPTGEAGSFDIFCSIPCGPGHRDMKATVVVQ